jgi:hypothetical protein
MSRSNVARVLLIALLVAVVAGAGEATGLAPAWAVLAGVAVAAAGAPPVVHRGVTALAGGLLALLLALALPGATSGSGWTAALAVGLLAAAGGLLQLRADPRVRAWPLLVGGATVLSAASGTEGPGVEALAPGLTGLAAGLLPLQVAEVVALARSRAADGEHRGDDETPAVAVRADAEGEA